MKLPRVRITVRRMMVMVAALALSLGAYLHWGARAHLLVYKEYAGPDRGKVGRYRYDFRRPGAERAYRREVAVLKAMGVSFVDQESVVPPIPPPD